MRRVVVSALALFVLVVPVACSSDGGSDGAGTTTAAPTTTSRPLGTDAAYAERGPHQVGTRTLALDDGRRVVVWYPAADSARSAPAETFDIASLLSPALQAQIPAELRPQYEIDAHPGAEPADGGPFPVILFSHGFAGFPEQSADLTTHLASWGFVVIAPDHVERSLSGLLGTASQGVPAKEDPAVLSASLDAAVADAKADDSPLHGLLDTDEVGVAGHSAGAGAAYRTATTDPRIKAFISYSVGFGGPDGESAEPPPVPDVPGMIMLGDRDGIIPPAESRKVFEAMHPPKYLVEIAGGGHLVFSDICLIGRDQGGLVGLVRQAGLDLPANLLRLASDGCEKGDLLPSKAFAAIDHLSVAFFRRYLGVDDEAVGLAPGVTKVFKSADVTLVAVPG